MLSKRVLNRTLAYQINREEAPPGNNQKDLLEGKPTVQLNRTLGFPENRVLLNPPLQKMGTPNRERFRQFLGLGAIAIGFAWHPSQKTPLAPSYVLFPAFLKGKRGEV